MPEAEQFGAELGSRHDPWQVATVALLIAVLAVQLLIAFRVQDSGVEVTCAPETACEVTG